MTTPPGRAATEPPGPRPSGATLDAGALIFWLIIMGGAVFDIARGRAHPGWLAALALVSFVALYVATALSTRRPGLSPYVRYGLLAALAAVSIAYVLRFGHNATESLTLLAMAAGAVLPLVVPAVAGVALCSAMALLIGLSGDSGSVSGLVSGTATAGTVIVVLRRLFTTINELRATREELAHAAVSRERLRFARDLHDLLGHTLSLIVVKGEIVQRLAVRDPEAAAAQAGDIIGIGRAALGEVREAVSGYRTRGVSAELDDARIALDDAGVEAVITRSGPPPSADADLLFGWVVREAVTNVIRHAAARRCRIDVTGDAAGVRLTVTDDGRGAPGGVTSGNGLTGLAERMTAAGGALRAEPGRRGGFTVTATLPVEGEAGA
jgi:two-component system sensor histidine kinase DesK